MVVPSSWFSKVSLRSQTRAGSAAASDPGNHPLHLIPSTFRWQTAIVSASIKSKAQDDKDDDDDVDADDGDADDDDNDCDNDRCLLSAACCWLPAACSHCNALRAQLQKR